MTRFESIRFQHYKGLRDAEIACRPGLNILVGKNNAGKSTALSPFRMLPSTLKSARSRRAVRIGQNSGWVLREDGLPVSLENVHTDLLDVDSSVTLCLDNGGQLSLVFPSDGGARMEASRGGVVTTAAAFRRHFPIELHVCPVLGPVEHDEPLLTRKTVERGWGTHRASRHFRNTWHHFPEAFPIFAELLAATWEGVTVEPPEVACLLSGPVLHLFVEERRKPRELYWCGFGFQIWCQLLTWVSRVSADGVFVVDEPETYLHPVLQRRFLEVLRGLGAQVFIATHSASIIASAHPGEVVLIDKDAGEFRRPERSGLELVHWLGMLPTR